MDMAVAALAVMAPFSPFGEEKEPRPPRGYRMETKGDEAEIYLYGLIGSSWFGDAISARQFAEDLKALGSVKRIDLRINSEGGEVFAGKAIYSLLVKHEAEIVVHVDGLAASAASFVAMAGKEIRIAEGAFMMIHNAWICTCGDAAELRRKADVLDEINDSVIGTYVARTGQDEAAIREMMDAETWMDGQAAVEKGFADILVEGQRMAACVRRPEAYRNLPAGLRPRRRSALADVQEMRRALAR